ncbi:MAG: aldose 1-epimerase family protein [Bacteroidetes bacterium]|nr:aldose 1-epimerase family protein [Bacteroidota bacterium]
MLGNLTHTIKNEWLSVSVREIGAELCRIKSVKSEKEYLWDGNPDIWASHAPVLFPIVGELKEGTYYYEGNRYQLPRHGFVRNNPKVQCTDQSESSLTFSLEYDEDSLLVYPFRFRLSITYALDGPRIVIQHRVENLDDKTMYFSLGAHPAFCIPHHEHESYDDYYLEFAQKETAARWLLIGKGLLSGETEPVLNDTAILPLRHELFSEDALVFKKLVSSQVSLRSKKSPEVVTVRYEDFPYLGVWAKPHGDYVCIEPWLGVADSADTDQQLINKEGILELGTGAIFNAAFTIEISE